MTWRKWNTIVIRLVINKLQSQRKILRQQVSYPLHPTYNAENDSFLADKKIATFSKMAEHSFQMPKLNSPLFFSLFTLGRPFFARVKATIEGFILVF